tara:strand:+ start:210 stop:986 length:777 start_codon:yes stop_codon:yes gene_type:complete
MMQKGYLGLGAVAMIAGAAVASVSDINGFVDAPRLFNDFSGSNLTYSSTFSPMGSSVTLRESDYGSGNFANRHASWFSDGGGNKVDFDYGDGFDMSMVMRINAADSVGNIEAGFQADLFGFGLFGVLTATGEVAAFGSTMPFHSFGAGVYNVGDDIALRMIHRPGAGEFSGTNSTIEYLYNNLTTGTGWVTSGEIEFTSLEGGIPSAFDQFYGVGAQINQPDALEGNVSIDFYDIIVPAPGAGAVLGLGALAATRRRR